MIPSHRRSQKNRNRSFNQVKWHQLGGGGFAPQTVCFPPSRFVVSFSGYLAPDGSHPLSPEDSEFPPLPVGLPPPIPEFVSSLEEFPPLGEEQLYQGGKNLTQQDEGNHAWQGGEKHALQGNYALQGGGNHAWQGGEKHALQGNYALQGGGNHAWQGGEKHALQGNYALQGGGNHAQEGGGNYGAQDGGNYALRCQRAELPMPPHHPPLISCFKELILLPSFPLVNDTRELACPLSKKVFVCGLPLEVTEVQIGQLFLNHNMVSGRWFANDAPNLNGKTAHLTFEKESDVRRLLVGCYWKQFSNEFFFPIGSPTNCIQLVPWRTHHDRYYGVGKEGIDFARNKIATFSKAFGQLTATQLASEVTQLYGQVDCCIFDTAGKGANSYPIGSGKLVFEKAEDCARAVKGREVPFELCTFSGVVEINSNEEIDRKN